MTHQSTCLRAGAAEQVKLVVVDSVTFHFRQDITDMGQRTRMLAAMAQQLMQAAEAHDAAVRMPPHHVIRACNHACCCTQPSPSHDLST